MQLDTARLVLREFVPEDWAAVLAYQQDPRYLTFYAWESRTEPEVRRFVQMFLDYQAETPRRKYQLAVTLRADGRLIGNCGLRRPAADALVAEVGYELAPDQWGRGYATEAARAVVAWGFETLGLHRIHANLVAENRASAHVLEKLGFALEGRLREHEWFKGRWHDNLLYGILDREWRKD